MDYNHRVHKQHHVHHPAHNMYLITLLLLAGVVIFGFITVFIPWAVKDIGVGKRAWAYPFKTCIEETFSEVNQETCIDNDFIEPRGVGLTAENEECKAYILATIAFVFISVLIGVVDLILLGYMLEHMAWIKIRVALVAQFLLILICIACFLTWIFFIVYAGMLCAAGSIFPVHGYSYGFIMYLFATAMSIGSVVTGFLGIHKLRRYKDMEQARNELIEELPVYNAYPMGPVPLLPQPVYPVMAPGAVPYLPAPTPPMAPPVAAGFW